MSGMHLTAQTPQFSASSEGSPGGTWKWAWLGYALPGLLAWAVYLAAFWPGLMSADSLDQWHQILTGQFSDVHPAFHTLANWLITRIWLSPAAIAITQIAALSLGLALAMKEWTLWGVPRSVRLLSTLAFAVSPVNGMMSITLWKDVPYAISFLALFVVLSKVVRTRGAWLTAWHHDLALAGVLASMALFRHNGLPTALVIFGVVFLCYRRRFRNGVVFVGAATLAIIFAVKGPLFRLVGVREAPPNLMLIPVSHQLGALLASGVKLDEDQARLLSGMQPIDEWQYKCYTAGPILFSGLYDGAFVDAHWKEILSTWFELAAQHPRTLLRHQLCVTSLIWRMSQPVDGYIYTYHPGIDPNNLGLSSTPLLPGAQSLIDRILAWSMRPDDVWWIWRPAIYLYLTVGCVALCAFRTRHLDLILLALPSIANSLILMALIVAQDFRYQYPVYVLGLLSPCLLFVSYPPAAASGPSQEKTASSRSAVESQPAEGKDRPGLSEPPLMRSGMGPRES